MSKKKEKKDNRNYKNCAQKMNPLGSVGVVLELESTCPDLSLTYPDLSLLTLDLFKTYFRVMLTNLSKHMSQEFAGLRYA